MSTANLYSNLPLSDAALADHRHDDGDYEDYFWTWVSLLLIVSASAVGMLRPRHIVVRC